MANINDQRAEGTSEGLTRRGFLKAGVCGFVGLGLLDVAELFALERPNEGKAKSVIQLWMGGGPPHLDTFDPKPFAGEEYCGPYKKPIATNVPGIQVCEMLPLLARQADKYSILRSMTHPSNSHETGTYIMQTGTLPTGDLVYPSIGAVVALKRTEAGYKSALPPYITLTNPLGRFTESGFLGAAHRAFVTGGDPNAKDFSVSGLVPPAGMTQERLAERRTLLRSVDSFARERGQDPEVRKAEALQNDSYGLILGEAKKAFDLSQEKDEVREQYGRNGFGQSCLLARRLVAGGVPFVTVNSGGWDTHKNHFEAMKNKLPILDKGFAALLEDLSQRGLLDSTIVVWCGEFGRTPKILRDPPWNGGRNHFSTVFSCVVAGGGFKGGKVVGSSDGRGERVKDRPVYPWDLSASLYKLLGIDPGGKLPHPHGCVAYVTPQGGNVARGGLLTEIM